jgi:hypothetical protein
VSAAARLSTLLQKAMEFPSPAPFALRDVIVELVPCLPGFD